MNLLALAIVLVMVASLLASEEPTMSLLEFGPDDETPWAVVNDGVMGGISSSQIRRTEAGTAVFEGELSLENNGGFASVRALLPATDLSEHAGMALRVRGDGRQYQLRLRDDTGMDGVAHRAHFETKAGEWIDVRIPFERFEASFRGRILTDAPPLDRAGIRQIAFMLADKNPGPFQLEIEFVGAYDDADAP